LLTTLAAPAIAAAISRSLTGVTPQEEEDIRLSRPAFERGQPLMYVGRDDTGSPRFLNVGYVNPFNDLAAPAFMAAMSPFNKDKTFLDSMSESIAGALKPLANPQIFTQAAIEVYTNQTRTGRPLYNTQDDFGNKAEAVIKHMYEALEPGTVARTRKNIIPAFSGGDNTRAVKDNPWAEVAAELTGFKVATVDFKQAVLFKARNYMVEGDKAARLYSESLLGPRAEDADGVVKAYDRSESARFALQKELYSQIRAARRERIPDDEIIQTLLDSGLHKDVVGRVFNGLYTPLRVDYSHITQTRMVKDSQAGKTFPIDKLAELMASNYGLSLEGNYERK
jgi:hypothetical protein